MTLFEYLSVALSIVLAFGATHILGNLRYVLDKDRRYWVHAIWVHLILIGVTAAFWVFWSYRDLEWTYPRFLIALASPAIGYYNACTLIPEMPGSVASWREYFYATGRKRFFGLSLLGENGGSAAQGTKLVRSADPPPALVVFPVESERLCEVTEIGLVVVAANEVRESLRSVRRQVVDVVEAVLLEQRVDHCHVGHRCFDQPNARRYVVMEPP